MSRRSPEVTVEGEDDKEFVVHGSLQNPLLWSPAHPNLYSLKTEVYADGKVTDTQTDRIGVRSIHITPGGLALNGEKTFLRGVNRHQEYPYIGYALSDAAQYRDAYKIKQAGFDFVRCSHYPMSPAFLDACDELGIMVLDAILGWQYFGDAAFERLALQSGRELIRRDRNHPSVLAWELSINETGMPKSFTDSAHLIAHQEYPYNGCYSAGWVRESYDIYIEARQHRHGLYPEKPLLVSEYGDWEYFAQNAGFNQQDWKDLLEGERNSRQPRFAGEKRLLQQALNIQEAHNDNLSTHAFADGYWVMFDYNRGMAPDQEYSGVMDIFRLPKFSYYFFQSQRDCSDSALFSKPVVFIASYWQPGVSRGVRVFSNCDEVELFVDGKPVGRRKPDSNAVSINLPHPPFTFDVACTKPGTLEYKAFKGGKMVAQHSVSSPSVPDHLQLSVDESGRAPGLNDVIFVYATISDSKNNIVPNDSSEVRFQVEGAGVMGPSVVQAQAGIATILVRTGNKPSDIKVTAVAHGLKQDVLTLKIQSQHNKH
jgi:beta-galactosidase